MEFDAPWWDPDCEVIFLVWEDEVRRAASVYTLRQHNGFTYFNLKKQQRCVGCASFISCHDSGCYGGSDPRSAEILDKEVVWFHCAQTH